jgi:hypothetical protein
MVERRGPAGLITRDLGSGPNGFRCCLLSAVADPVNGMMYASWNSRDATRVKLSSSRNGTDWTHQLSSTIRHPHCSA